MSFSSALSRWHARLFALVKIHLAEVFAYRATAVIWVIGDLQVAVLMPLVWMASGGITGFTNQETASYYLITMTLSQFVTCHLLWDIGFDIREGAFAVWLLRPIDHLAASFARNIAWRVGKLALFLPLLIFLVPFYGTTRIGGLSFGVEFWIALAGGFVLSFLAAYTIAMVALWTTEFISIFELYYIPEMLLSGRVFPLVALPEWAEGVTKYAHFRYTVSFPTEIAMGRLSPGEIQGGFVVQAAWVALFAVLSRVLFAKGTQQYSGFGT